MRKLNKREILIIGVSVPVLAVIIYIYAIVFLDYFGGHNAGIRIFILRMCIVPPILVFGWVYLILRYAGEKNFIHERFTWY